MPLGIGIVAAIAALVWAAVWFQRRIWFYRDPQRSAPAEPRLAVAPCDGKVVYVKRVQGGKVFAEKLGHEIEVSELIRAPWPTEGDETTAPAKVDGWLVGIYMSPLDIHYNYAPIEGNVRGVVHTQANLNLPMVDLWEYVQLTYLRRAVNLFGKRYHLENERNTIFLENEGLRVAVVEIADKFVNKIRCYVQPGDHVARGQKLSFIERGSQVDLFFYRTDVDILVKVGDQVYGCLTPLARY